jgi:integrase
VAFYLEHGAAPVKRMRLWDLLDLAVETKEEEGKSDRYLAQLRSSVGQLCRWEGWGERWAHELTREAVEDWAGGNGWSGKTRRNYVIDVRTVLEFGTRVGAVSRNVTNGMVLPAGTPEGEPGILSVREAARLVAMARRKVARDGTVVRDGLLLGYVVLGLFAGLRPDRELGLLKWSAVDLDGGTVVVDGKSAKGRRRRVVDLSPGAVALLKLAKGWSAAAGMEGVVPRNFRKRWEALRASAGLLEGWVPDGMRHSYASYHLALHENEGRLKAQMGHAAGSEVLWQHYRARVTRGEAARFWQIGAPRPGS